MPREKPTLYFPTTVGTKWVYEFNRADGEKKWPDETEVLFAVEEGKDGAKVATIHRTLPDRTYPFQKWEVSEQGLCCIEKLVGPPLRSPLCFLKLPQREGQSWDLGDLRDVKLTAYGPERVKVPAGEFNAIRVEHWSTQYEGVRPNQICWYAVDVGLVKLESGDIVVTLKSFTRGKE